jgi:hypothetical protein
MFSLYYTDWATSEITKNVISISLCIEWSYTCIILMIIILMIMCDSYKFIEWGKCAQMIGYGW